MTYPLSLKGLVDLHFHSECSGDSYMPLYALIPAAERLGLAAIAKTDHDSLEGCTWLAEQAQDSSVEYIPGVEMSTNDGFHIIGYYIDPANEALRAGTAIEQEYGQRKLDDTLKAWKAGGGNLPDDPVAFAESIRDLRIGRQISMKQIVDHLVGQAFYPHAAGAFEDAGQRLEQFTPPPHTPPSAEAIIANIMDAGGVAVIAHPSPRRVDEVKALLAAGAIGVGAYNVKAVNPEARRFWEDHARKHNIVLTGGTDWHKPVETWNILVPTITPYMAVEGLKKAVKQIHGREV